MNFGEKLGKVARKSVLAMEDWVVWGAAPVKADDGKYYLLFARWPRALEHYAWISHSEIACAVSDDALGPYEVKGTVVKGRGGDYWDGASIHNPTMLKDDGKYYLYYMGNKGGQVFEGIPTTTDDNWWAYRNNQRIGVAVADHPLGPWKRFDHPVMDVTPHSHDGLLTSNPSVTKGVDGKFYMVYKAVAEGETNRGKNVICGVAVADHPLGPFKKYAQPVMTNPKNGWSVEDPYIWCQDGQFYALVKDFNGDFTGGEKGTMALFESQDCYDWHPSEHPFAVDREIHWEDGEVEKVDYLERPQLLFEEGKAIALFVAVANTSMKIEDRNIHIPLVDA